MTGINSVSPSYPERLRRAAAMGTVFAISNTVSIITSFNVARFTAGRPLGGITELACAIILSFAASATYVAYMCRKNDQSFVNMLKLVGGGTLAAMAGVITGIASVALFPG